METALDRPLAFLLDEVLLGGFDARAFGDFSAPEGLNTFQALGLGIATNDNPAGLLSVALVTSSGQIQDISSMARL